MTKLTFPQSKPFPAARWIVLVLALFSFGMSAFVSRTVFERLPHLEDEVAYLFQARTLARGDLVIDTPEPRRAFWQPFVVDFRHAGDEEYTRFGKYTLGYPLVLAVGELMGQGWVINAFFAALTVAIVYRLGREVFNEDVGLIASALVAFSPAALLLNATLMGHTSALFFATAFIYAYWRLERGRKVGGWMLAAGVMLGALVINRPVTGIGIALPFVVRSLMRLIYAFSRQDRFAARLRRTASVLAPLVGLGVITILFAVLIPVYNDAATGQPGKNLYTLVWEYDTVGFGTCCGRTGHTLEKGVRHLRFDMSLTAADLFGWAAGRVTIPVQEHLRTNSNYYPIVGLSFVLFPFTLFILFRWRSLLLIVWGALLVGWFIFPFTYQGGWLTRDPQFAWGWLVTVMAWVLLPILFWGERTRSWAWLLTAVMLSIVGVQLAYWIGSQRYSTRYYYEALSAAAILSAVPLAWLARRFSREIVYGLLAVALTWSLYAYSTGRITALYRFNNIHHDLINGVNARRNGDQPVLVIVNGDNVRWRAFGSLMAVTSPYLDSDIVVAHNYRGAVTDDIREQILERFPDRQVIEMQAAENQAWFEDDPPEG